MVDVDDHTVLEALVGSNRYPLGDQDPRGLAKYSHISKMQVKTVGEQRRLMMRSE